MPTSSYKRVAKVLAILHHIRPPKRVLDIGVGFGKYGLLLREHLDVRKRRYAPGEWQTVIDGVEAWGQYITPVHRHVYDEILIGDIRELKDEIGSYDLMVLADVIEHMPYEQGVEVLTALFQKCTGGMVVSYPKAIGSDWRNWENPHERHHVVWTEALFRELFGNKARFNGTQVVYLLKGV